MQKSSSPEQKKRVRINRQKRNYLSWDIIIHISALMRRAKRRERYLVGDDGKKLQNPNFRPISPCPDKSELTDHKENQYPSYNFVVMISKIFETRPFFASSSPPRHGSEIVRWTLNRQFPNQDATGTIRRIPRFSWDKPISLIHDWSRVMIKTDAYVLQTISYPNEEIFVCRK